MKGLRILSYDKYDPKNDLYIIQKNIKQIEQKHNDFSFHFSPFTGQSTNYEIYLKFT